MCAMSISPLGAFPFGAGRVRRREDEPATSPRSGGNLVHGLELELDFLPGLHRNSELGAVAGGLGQDLATLAFDLAALVPCLHARLERHAVGVGAGCVAPRVAERAAAELQAGVVAEEDAALAVLGYVGLPQRIDPAHRGLAIAFELADDGAGVEMIAPGEAQ